MEIYTQENYLRSCRKKLGFTQDDLAEVIGLKSGTTVSKHEASKRLPSFLEALSYEIVCGQSLKDIFRGDYSKLKHETAKRVSAFQEKLKDKPPSVVKEYQEKMAELILERL